jgi:hypothetical protein
MAEEWNDLFLRTDLSETSPAKRVGGLGSPDIIPAGTSPSDPYIYTTPESYARYYNQPLMQNVPNYIYVRAKNSSSSSPKFGEVGLTMSNPSIVLWPGGDGWTVIKTAEGRDRSPITSTAPGKVGVTTDPFVFVPSEFGHRCLASWVSTPDHPIIGLPPKITSMDALAKFLIAHPNYAHHNIDIVQDTTGKVTRVDPYTQGDKGCTVVFGIQTVGCKGFKVSFTCGKQLPDGKFINLNEYTVTTDDSITITIDRDVPAGFQADIAYTYDQMNLKPEKFSVTFVAYFDVPPTHELYEFALPYEHLGVANAANYGANRGIQVGSIGVMKGAK